MEPVTKSEIVNFERKRTRMALLMQLHRDQLVMIARSLDLPVGRLVKSQLAEALATECPVEIETSVTVRLIR